LHCALSFRFAVAFVRLPFAFVSFCAVCVVRLRFAFYCRCRVCVADQSRFVLDVALRPHFSQFAPLPPSYGSSGSAVLLSFCVTDSCAAFAFGCGLLSFTTLRAVLHFSVLSARFRYALCVSTLFPVLPGSGLSTRCWISSRSQTSLRTASLVRCAFALTLDHTCTLAAFYRPLAGYFCFSRCRY